MLIRLLLTALALSLAACGGPSDRETLSTGAGAIANPAQFRVVPPNFSDADPASFGRRGPEDHQVHGIDVARFQTSIDWQQARANGVNFAFIKATEGGDMVDPMFDSHWRGAGAVGVKRGAYHFFYHCRPAAEQARWFIRHVPKTPGALPPVLDMEWTPTSPTWCMRTRRC